VRDRHGNETDVNLYFALPNDIFNNWKRMQSFKYSETDDSKKIQRVLDKLEPEVKKKLVKLNQFAYKLSAPREEILKNMELINTMSKDVDESIK
jgi:hypothetical protein